MLNQLKSNSVYIILGILAVNIFVLDYFVFIGSPKQIIQNINLGSAESESSSRPTAQTASDGQTIASAPSCPITCIDTIRTATSSLKLNPTIIIPTTTPAAVQTITTTGGANEYFVPFGAATGSSQGSFTNVGGIQSYINMSEYSNVSNVVFEVTVGGSGIVTVQLYNATDGYVIPNSTVTMPGGSPQLLISSPLSLPTGNKLYQVQLQTQLNDPATINSARLHITTN